MAGMKKLFDLAGGTLDQKLVCKYLDHSLTYFFRVIIIIVQNDAKMKSFLTLHTFKSG
jgi:hypothetical protein